MTQAHRAALVLSLMIGACRADSPTSSPVSEPALVVVTPQRATVTVGESALLSVRVSDAGGQPLTVPVRWFSEDPTIATVTAIGRVIGVGRGTVNIVAITTNGIRGIASVVVSAAPVDSTPTLVLASITAGTLAIGETRQATATVLTRQGRPLPSVGVAWTSSAAGVATVSAMGVVTGVGAGTARVTARFESLTASFDVVVEADAALRIVGSRVFVPGATAQFTVVGSEVRQSSAAAPVRWFTSDSLVARVSETGLVSGWQPGKAVITAVVGGATSTLDVETRVLPGWLALALPTHAIGLFRLDGSFATEVPGFQLAGPRSVDLSPSGEYLTWDCDTGVCWGLLAGGTARSLSYYYDDVDPGSMSWPTWVNDGTIGFKLGDSYGELDVSGRSESMTGGPGRVMARPRLHTGLVVFECEFGLCTFTGQPVYALGARRVAFARTGAVAYDTPAGLCVINLGEAACRSVISHEPDVIVESAWSPDGEWLAYTHLGALWLMQKNGGNILRLPRAGGGVSSPSWSGR